MRWLALLVLAQNVNVTPIETRQDGVRVPQRILQRQYVVDCLAGMTCSVDGGVLYLQGAASSGGGYDGGKVNDAYAADASITAQTFDHNPTDCSATQYATAIDSAGNLTCSTPPSSGGGGPIPSFGGF